MSSPDTEFIRILGTAPGGTEAQPPRAPAKTLPSELAILGLSDIVIFPGMVAPLLVDTAQSIRLIDDVVEGDRLLGVVLQRKPELDNPEPQDLHEYGCAGRVLKMLKFPDNTVRVLVEGLWRVRLSSFISRWN
jgi:ATP-dependent Lon protease